jgi:hypothetical protein
MAESFHALLFAKDGGEALHIIVPFDVHKVFGTRARLAVKGTINGFPFRSSIFPMGDGRFYMVVNKEMRAGSGAVKGKTAAFVMEKDDQPRTVEAPADFARALKANKAAKAAWDKLSYTHRKEYIEAIEEAKKPETRLRRIEKAVEMIAAMKPAAKPAAKKAAKPAAKEATKSAAKSRAKKAPAKKSAK